LREILCTDAVSQGVVVNSQHKRLLAAASQASFIER
jgi:hypothetical protein